MTQEIQQTTLPEFSEEQTNLVAMGGGLRRASEHLHRDKPAFPFKEDRLAALREFLVKGIWTDQAATDCVDLLNFTAALERETIDLPYLHAVRVQSLARGWMAFGFRYADAVRVEYDYSSVPATLRLLSEAYGENKTISFVVDAISLRFDTAAAKHFTALLQTEPDLATMQQLVEQSRKLLQTRDLGCAEAELATRAPGTFDAIDKKLNDRRELLEQRNITKLTRAEALHQGQPEKLEDSDEPQRFMLSNPEHALQREAVTQFLLNLQTTIEPHFPITKQDFAIANAPNGSLLVESNHPRIIAELSHSEITLPARAKDSPIRVKIEPQSTLDS